MSLVRQTEWVVFCFAIHQSAWWIGLVDFWPTSSFFPQKYFQAIASESLSGDRMKEDQFINKSPGRMVMM